MSHRAGRRPAQHHRRPYVREKRQSNLAPVLEPLPDRLVLRTHRPASSSSRPKTRTAIRWRTACRAPRASRMARNPVLLIDSNVEQDGWAPPP